MIAFDDIGGGASSDVFINHLINSIQLVQSSMNTLIMNEFTLGISVHNLSNSVASISGSVSTMPSTFFNSSVLSDYVLLTNYLTAMGSMAQVVASISNSVMSISNSLTS